MKMKRNQFKSGQHWKRNFLELKNNADFDGLRVTIWLFIPFFQKNFREDSILWKELNKNFVVQSCYGPKIWVLCHCSSNRTDLVQFFKDIFPA